MPILAKRCKNSGQFPAVRQAEHYDSRMPRFRVVPALRMSKRHLSSCNDETDNPKYSSNMRTSGSAIERRLFWREFSILFCTGTIADLILLAISRPPTTPVAMFLFVKDNLRRPVALGFAAAESAIELTLFIGLGLLAAHAVGSGAPNLEKWLRGEPIRPHLRSVFVPALVVGVLIGLWVVVPNLPIFHPNRQSTIDEAEKILNSPAGAKIDEFLNRTSGPGLTTSELALLDVCDVIQGELAARLFLLSGIVWILAKATRTAPDAGSRTLVWTSIFLAIAVGATLNLAWQHIFHRLMMDALGGIWLPSDPFWMIVTRPLLKIVPAGVALGWLYMRRGLESAIIASLIASAAGYAATTFAIERLY